MKTKLLIVLTAVASLLLTSQAMGAARPAPKIDAKLLTGVWKGTFQMEHRGQTEREQVTMTFEKGGRFLVENPGQKQQEAGTWEVKGDHIVLTEKPKDAGKKGSQIKLVDVKLTATELKAEMKPVATAGAAPPPGMKITLDLKRQKD